MKKAEISKKNFAGQKKSSTSEKCFRSAKSAKLKKEQIKIENKHRKGEEKPENNYRKFRQKLERTKKMQIWKIGKT